MTRYATVSLASVLLAALFVTAGAPAAAQTSRDPSAREIIQRADRLQRGNSQQGVYRMTVVRPEWERSTRFEFWSEGTEKSFIRVLEPARDRGVTFLKVGREMWNYVPRVNRVIKIPPSMMLQSWMGSDFTNDDLVKESSVIDDYEHRLVGRETMDGAEAWRIELVPKPSAAVAWARFEEWIRVADYAPLRAVYYNERGEHVRTLLFTDIRRSGTRPVPWRLELIEETKPGRKTVLQIESIVYDRPIDASIFSQQHLRSGS